jgi:hypothetical protein
VSEQDAAVVIELGPRLPKKRRPDAEGSPRLPCLDQSEAIGIALVAREIRLVTERLDDLLELPTLKQDADAFPPRIMVLSDALATF